MERITIRAEGHWLEKRSETKAAVFDVRGGEHTVNRPRVAFHGSASRRLLPGPLNGVGSSKKIVLYASNGSKRPPTR